jgi:hypothetical protein
MSNIESEIREIAERIAHLVRDAYRRGETDALERLVRLARSDQGQVETRAPAPALGAVAISGKARKRAPKGAVEMLVGRALSNGSGKTPDEIKAYAATDYEQMVRVPSIRSHLSVGEKEGRYRKQGSRWYLTSGSSIADDQ